MPWSFFNQELIFQKHYICIKRILEINKKWVFTKSKRKNINIQSKHLKYFFVCQKKTRNENFSCTLVVRRIVVRRMNDIFFIIIVVIIITLEIRNSKKIFWLISIIYIIYMCCVDVVVVHSSRSVM